MSVKRSEKRFLLGASTLIVLTISLFSISTVALHLSTRQLFIQLQAQADEFQSFERQAKDLARAEQLHRDHEFVECIHITQAIPVESPHWIWAQSLSDKCHVEVATIWRDEAHEWAAQDQLLKAVVVASRIKSGEHYEPMQRQIRDWTRQILDFAKAHYHRAGSEADVDHAIAIVMQIPPDNPLYEEAIALRNEWRRNQMSHEQNLRAAQEALKKGDIALVHSLAKEVIDPQMPSVWRNRWSDLIGDAEARRADYNSYQEMAQRHLEQGNYEQALAQAQQLPDRAFWGEKKVEIIAQAEDQRQAEDNNRRTAQETMRIIAATLGGSGFGFLGGLSRR